MKKEMNITLENFESFTLEELEEAIKWLKLGKASGLDGITTEMIRQFGTKTRAWILEMVNIFMCVKI